MLFVVLLCKGTAFVFDRQETHWFLLVLFSMAYKKSVKLALASSTS